MPELPEVEVTRREISGRILGRTIERVTTTKNSYFFLSSPTQLRRSLPGRTIRQVDRLGKYLLLGLGDPPNLDSLQLLLHLGMTGQLFVGTPGNPRLLSSTAGAAVAPSTSGTFRADAHTHLRLAFSDGPPDLFFRDVRKFGKVALLRDRKDPRLAKLGVDALIANGDHLWQAARRRRVPIKTLLLNQSVIAGIGNIYADEALFLASVRPTLRANRVSKERCDQLIQQVQRVMLRSIESGGSTISDYVRPDGADGGYQDERVVYAREGEPCRECQAPIKRIVIGQRSTHYCPTCQL